MMKIKLMIEHEVADIKKCKKHIPKILHDILTADTDDWKKYSQLIKYHSELKDNFLKVEK